MSRWSKISLNKHEPKNKRNKDKQTAATKDQSHSLNTKKNQNLDISAWENITPKGKKYISTYVGKY